MKTKIDHFVIAAKTLEEGVRYLRDTLGVDIPYGGEHPQMGTHNHLMRLSDDIFLEVIAINPEGQDPSRPRWFDLDNPIVQDYLQDGPRLLTWVINTDDIEKSLQGAQVSCGEAQQIKRGNLSWYFGLPSDGRLLAGGFLPYIIQWQCEDHPASTMADLGCHYLDCTIHHSKPKWLAGALSSLNAEEHVQVVENVAQPAYMELRVQTPQGIRTLSSKRD